MNTKEYVFNFIGGGSNSEFATSIKEAKDKAKSRGYNTPIDFKSFRVPSEKDMNFLIDGFL
mgnify:CR=1 FL=1|tara:strand:+ start:421 stop:603 length:183 start_codon:yes stop_codon:yes gene_type:complete